MIDTALLLLAVNRGEKPLIMSTEHRQTPDRSLSLDPSRCPNSAAWRSIFSLKWLVD